MYVFEPKVRADKSPVIYFIHGGGYLVGSAVQQNAELFEPAEQVGAVVVNVEYRQAGDAPPRRILMTLIMPCLMCLIMQRVWALMRIKSSWARVLAVV